MTDYSARIRAKGLDNTGVTEKVATNMHGRLGSYGMAVVEYKIVRASNDDDGKHKVELTIEHFEPAVNTDLDEHLRGITRALHTNRVLHSDDGQLTIDGQDDIAPKMADLILAGEAMFFPHAAEEEDVDQDDSDDDTGEEPDGWESDPSNPTVTPDDEYAVDPDATHAATRDQAEDETWEYPEPESAATVSSLPNPFAAVPS